MYLREGETPEEEEEIIHLKQKILDWEHNVVEVMKNGKVTNKPTKQEMVSDFQQLQKTCKGYWCE
jgi:hypothetical protein